MTVYATDEDIQHGRRSLTSDQAIEAKRLISAVSAWITDRKPDVDVDQAKFVVVDVVRYAMDTAKMLGHTTYSRAVGGVSRSGTLVEPGGSLVITDFHKQLLGISIATLPKYHFGDT